MLHARKLFGTDGLRAEYGIYPLDQATLLHFAETIASWLKRYTLTHTPLIVLGRDPRESGIAIEQLLKSQFMRLGLNVIILGVLPTPALSFMTQQLKGDLGIMISASHNSYQDNGIKLFKSDGSKLSDREEAEIENLFFMQNNTPDYSVQGQHSLELFQEKYAQFLLGTLSSPLNLSGLKIALDCAHGATYQIAPYLLKQLGAEIIEIGSEPDGININRDRGSVSPAALCAAVIQNKCDLGIAFDGDGDRLLFVDQSGQTVNGDQLMAILSDELIDKSNPLLKKYLVATVMSNLGLETYLARQNIELLRTKVGDRYVYEEMIKNGYTLGGEQSGHIIMLNYSPTGDGLLAALHILAFYRSSPKKHSFFQKFHPIPQQLHSIHLKDFSLVANNQLNAEIEKIQSDFSSRGRLLIRKSGTEPVLRIMIECEDEKLLQTQLNQIFDLLTKTSA